MSRQVTGLVRGGSHLFIVTAMTVVLGGCAGGSDGTAGAGDGFAERSATMPPESGTPSEGGEPSTSATESEQSDETPTDDDGGGNDPNGPDLQLFTLPECEVIPGGSLSGADVLTMFVAVRNGGPGDFDGLAPVDIVSDTGLEASINAGISTGSSFNALQIDLTSDSYNRTHRFTITADPDEETLERDESNNELQITVDLPDRPDGATDVACTSP